MLCCFCAEHRNHSESEPPKSLGAYTCLAVGLFCTVMTSAPRHKKSSRRFLLLLVLMSLLKSLLLAKPGSFWPLWSCANRFSSPLLCKVGAILGKH